MAPSPFAKALEASTCSWRFWFCQTNMAAAVADELITRNKTHECEAHCVLDIEASWFTLKVRAHSDTQRQWPTCCYKSCLPAKDARRPRCKLHRTEISNWLVEILFDIPKFPVISQHCCSIRCDSDGRRSRWSWNFWKCKNCGLENYFFKVSLANYQARGRISALDSGVIMKMGLIGDCCMCSSNIMKQRILR